MLTELAWPFVALVALGVVVLCARTVRSDIRSELSARRLHVAGMATITDLEQTRMALEVADQRIANDLEQTKARLEDARKRLELADLRKLGRAG